MKRLTATFAVVLLLTDLASAQPPLERVIAESIRVRVPVSECVVPAIVVQISRALAIPAGVEYLPEECRTHPPQPLSDEIDLYGLTAQEAFDKLVSVDQRYRWLESEGVVIVRPLAAWADPNHFLHRSIPDFAVSDVGIRRAIGAVQNAIGPYVVSRLFDFPERTPQGNQHVSLNLGTTSAFEALNAIVRAHGSMLWRLTYCRPEARLEFADFGFFTFDGSGGGSRSAFPRDENGKSYDPCAGTNRK